MKYLRVGALVGVGLALTSMVVNCRDHDVSTVTGAARETPSEEEQVAIDRCVPGQTIACMGGCGAPSTGYQVCAADGRSYGGCICPPLNGPVPTRGEGEPRIVSRGPLVGLPTTGPSASTGAGLVGAACRQDGDCITGLGCLTAAGGELNFSGPAGGYCTISCGTDAACQAIDRGSECVGFAGQNICVRSCASRLAPSGVSKCLDRADVMCVSVAALDQEDPADGPQRGLCLPACQSDAQCGPGLFCDLGNGLCTSERPAGDPVGSSCDGAESCASGLCLTLSDRFQGFCSGFCRFGSPGCGSTGSEPETGCAIAQVPGEGIGDRGFCLELCRDASDCLEAGAVCLATAQGSDTRVCVVPTGTPPVTPPDAGEPGGAPRTGVECAGNTECGAGFQCLTPDSDPFGLGGGFAGGYCSTSCADANCTEPGSVCVTTDADAGGFCLRACNPQTGGDCGERSELLCIPFSADATTGFCLPDCSAGADCGDRVCDPELGLCVDRPATEPPAGSSTGNACDAAEDCADGASCLSVDSDPFLVGGGPAGGYCSADCANAACSDPGAVCVRTSGGSFCLRGCDPTGDADCGRETAVCDTFPGGDPTLGFCRPQCNFDSDCGARVCAGNGLCVDPGVPECAQDEDCLTSQTCVAGECSDEAPGCTTDEDCGTGDCDTETQTCVQPEPECTADGDCTAGVCDVQLGQCVLPPAECTTDGDCGERVCDLTRGLCIDAACLLDENCAVGVCDPTELACIPAPPIPAGGACTADAECVGGLCASTGSGARFCSGGCLFGTAVGCEPYGSDAFCLVPLPAPDDDLGFCIELCNTPADCEQAGYLCLNIGTTINGRTGGCLPPAPAP